MHTNPDSIKNKAAIQPSASRGDNVEILNVQHVTVQYPPKFLYRTIHASTFSISSLEYRARILLPHYTHF